MPFKITSLNLLILTLLVFTLSACNQASNQYEKLIKQTDTNSNTSTIHINSLANNNDIEEKIIDTILKLPEAKERAKYIELQTKGERHLKVWIEDTPNLPDQKYYWIKVGEDNGTNLVTHFNFYVYPDSMRIMYFDIVNDEEIDLDTWRKQAEKN